MQEKRIGKAVLAVAGTVVLAAGAVQAAAAYRAGKGFSPDAAADLQVNQVVFDNKEQQTTQNEKQDGESELWQRDEEARRQEDLTPRDNADYLFEGQTSAGTQSDRQINLNTGSASQLQNREGSTAAGDTVYDVVSDPAQADVIIRSGEGDGTGSIGTGGDGSDSSSDGGNGTNNPRPTQGPAPTAAPQPTTSPVPTARPADTARDPEISKQYPDDDVAKNNPYHEGITPRDPSDENGDNPSVYIGKPYIGATGYLYLGQTIPSKRTLFNALETYVLGSDGVRYLWGEDAFDVYVRIDEVSFDGGKTWTSDFPLTIPTSLPDDTMKIRAAYRFSTKGEWVERIVDYVVERNRVFVLSQPITEDNTVIDPDIVLNDDQHQYLTDGEMVNLLRYQWDYLYDGTGDPLTSLFPGWEENGQKVDWFYVPTVGRHILEPMESVPLDDAYTVELVLEWMSDDYEVGYQYNNLCYLQTLTNYRADETDEDGRGFVETLEVPRYVQEVFFYDSADVTTDYLVVPDSVLNIDVLSYGLRVNKGYQVDEANPIYSARNGLLLNKGGTEILSIPAEMTRLVVPATVTRVELPAQNEIKELELQAQTVDQLPQINYTNMASGGKVLVKGSLLKEFISQDRTDLAAHELCAAAVEAPNVTYIVQNNAVVGQNGAVHWVLDGTRLIMEDNMKTLEAGAFDGADDLADVVLPASGQTVTLEKGCFAGSAVRRVLCYTQAQYDNITSQLAAAGGQVRAELLNTSREGFVYSVNSGDGGTLATLLSAPENLTEFDGTVTAQDGTAVSITEVADRAFAEQHDLVWVTLPESVETIGAEAFENCTALQGILIDTKDTITIGSNAINGCDALRFVASNAMTGILEDGYDPALRDSYKINATSYLFAPTNNEGYSSNWISFVEESGVAGYQVVSIGGSGRMLYGVDVDGNPWLGLRSSSEVPDEPQLPLATKELFNYALAQTTTPSGAMTIDWQALPNLFALDSGALRGSQLSGDVTFGENYMVFDKAIADCKLLTSVTLPGDNVDLFTDTFGGDSELKTITLGTLSDRSALYAGMANECFNLTDIYLLGDSLPQISLNSEGHFQFNYGWTEDEEAQNLRLHLPEGTEETSVKNWRYLFAGYFKREDKSAYMRMWDDIQENIYWDTFEFPTDEEVDAELEAQLLVQENRIRSMVGLELVDEPTDLYPYRVSEDGYITLVSAPRNITTASLSGSDIDLPDGWEADYIGSTTFARSKNLETVIIPETMVGIYSGAFAGTESETLNLYFWGETPPELMGATPEQPFDFGVPDEKLSINAFGNEETYIAEWAYPMAGYTDLAQMRELITTELTDADGNPPTNEEVDKVINERLLTAENRLRAMMGLDPVDDAADLVCEHPDGDEVEETPSAPATPESAQPAAEQAAVNLAQPAPQPEPEQPEQQTPATPETAAPATGAEEKKE